MKRMKTVIIVGVILIILGIVSFGYQGITYTTPRTIIDTGQVQVIREERHHIPYPIVLGGLFIIGGSVLLVTGIREATKVESG